MSWFKGNAEEALKTFQTEFDVFKEAKTNNDSLEKEIAKLEKRVKEYSSGEAELSAKIKELQGVSDIDPEAEIQRCRKQLSDILTEADSSRDKIKKDAENAKNQKLAQNEEKLKAELDAFDAAHDEDLTNLTETESRALEYTKQELACIKKRDEGIRKSTSVLDAERDKRDMNVNACNSEIEKIREAYQPDIDKWTDIINRINAKHRPAIKDAEADKRLEVNAKNRELDAIDQQIASKARMYSNAISDLEYQCRMNPDSVTWASELQKKRNACERDKQRLNAERNRICVKYENNIAKIDNKLSKLNDARAKELSGPQSKYDRFESDRDRKINVFKAKITDFNGAYENVRREHEKNVQLYQKECEDKVNKIHESMKDFAMSGENCLGEKYAELTAPFQALTVNDSTWVNLMDQFPFSSKWKSDMEEGARNNIYSEDYEDLIKDVDWVADCKMAIPRYYPYIWYVCGGGFVLLGLIFGIMHFIAEKGIFVSLILPAAVVIAGLYFMYRNMKYEYTPFLTGHILATEYGAFEAIINAANKAATEEEFQKLNEIGHRLLNQYKERNEIIEKHDANEKKIRAEYSATVTEADKKCQKTKSQKKGQYEERINELRRNAENVNSEKSLELQELKNQYGTLVDKIKKDSAALEKKKEKKQKQDTVVRTFKDNYDEFINLYLCGDRIGLSESMANSKGLLNNSIYLVSTEDEGGEYGDVCSIKHVDYDKNPYLVLYSEDVDNNQARQELLRGIVTDFLLAYKSINSKDIYRQYIIDNTGATTRLRQNEMQNLFNISKICNSMDDMKDDFRRFLMETNHMLENGKDIDKLNMERSANETPHIYKLVYFVYNGLPSGRLSDDIIQMLNYEKGKDCYGFIPIFICPEKEYEESIDKNNENLYTQIRDAVEDRILLYKGKKYYDYKR